MRIVRLVAIAVMTAEGARVNNFDEPEKVLFPTFNKFIFSQNNTSFNFKFV